jgi:hypothetical protein
MNVIKKVIVTIITLSSIATAYAKLPTYTLANALKKKLIEVKISGADVIQENSSGHYGKCLQIEITNLTTQRFKVKLINGQQFEPGDSSIQNMMLTEGEIFVFSPKRYRKEYINAMCVEKHDGAPYKNISFTVGSISDGHLLGISQLVEKYKYFNSTAQNAVWCISDGEDINTINSTDTLMQFRLQKFVSEATGQPMPTRHVAIKRLRPALRPSTNTVTFAWETSKTHKTTLVVLDKNNKPVKEVLKDIILPAGHHSYPIILSTANLPKGYYKVILYIDNKIAMQRRVRLGR